MPVQNCAPYKLHAWQTALHDTSLLYTFPNLFYDLTDGAPIGDLPPLTFTFIPENLKSAKIDPMYMDNFLVKEIATGSVNGPFTISQVHSIFNSHFHTAPLSLIEKPGSNALQMIRHHSKEDHHGHSTNGWINVSINATKYYSASDTADFVSTPTSLYFLLSTPNFKTHMFINTAAFFILHLPFCVCH